MPKDDIDYEKAGVTPPTSDAHLTEQEIAEQLSIKRLHSWKQQGAVLFCTSCPWEHATEPRFKDFLLQGTDSNGHPILKKLT